MAVRNACSKGLRPVYAHQDACVAAVAGDGDGGRELVPQGQMDEMVQTSKQKDPFGLQSLKPGLWFTFESVGAKAQGLGGRFRRPRTESAFVAF